MRNLLRVWLWLALLGPVAATAGGVWGPDSTARGDAATAQATADAATSSIANLKNGTDYATLLRVGADSSAANFSGSLLLSSVLDTGATNVIQGINYRSGIVGEAVATATLAGIGVTGIGKDTSARAGVGVLGVGYGLAASGMNAVGVWGEASQTGTGGTNTGLNAYAANRPTNIAGAFYAAGGTSNYAIYISGGDIFQGAATNWTATGGLNINGQMSYSGKVSGAADAAGDVGEIITATGTSAALTTGATANATSIVVTAGQWIIASQTYFTPAATTSITKLASSINTTSATHANAYSSVDVMPATVPTAAAPLPATGAVTRIVNSSGSATYYATCTGVFTVSTLTCTATITATRIR